MGDGSGGELATNFAIPATTASAEGSHGIAQAKIQGNAGDYLAPWIESEKCTSCDECIKINPSVFAYNEQKKAFIKDAHAGTYQELVKAAERCTAQIIHPGLPKDRSEKDIEKWISRGEKHN
jgi:pyruvate-ferredoxin/flavodoxin oxidoreductase